ncbi:MAG: tetratricopeptide repeat protein [Chryseolinea sp.]
MRKLVIIALLLFPIGVALSQDQVKLDSLERQLNHASHDTVKLKVLLDISLYYFNNNYTKAAEFAQQAKDLAGEKNFKEWEAKADRILGNTFLAIGDYKKASSHYFDALKFHEAENDTMGIAAACNNLGALYDRLHEFDKALTYYFKAQDLINNLRPDKQLKFRLSSLFNNIANVYQSKGDPKSALQYYQKALALAIETKNKNLQGIAYNNLGKLHLADLKDPAKAFEYLSLGLKVRLETGDKGEIAKSYNILAAYYLQQKQYSEARASLDEAVKYGKEIGSLEAQKFAYTTLSDVEEALGNYKASLAAFKNFKTLSDSMQNQLVNSEITRVQLQYDFEKAERERSLEQQQSQRRYITTIVVLAVGLVIAILIVIIIRNRIKQSELKRKNLSQDVEIKNKELTTNVMYLIRKNELINSVAERLLHLQSTIQPENHKIIHDIIIDLQREGDNDSWKEFELRFNQVHGDFYQQLRKLYPGLSPADEKLCAFLKLNMSSKEIAAITQQSIKSVEVARARLRKKLNLTNTNSNLVTHLSNL